MMKRLQPSSNAMGAFLVSCLAWLGTTGSRLVPAAAHCIRRPCMRPQLHADIFAATRANLDLEAVSCATVRSPRQQSPGLRRPCTAKNPLSSEVFWARRRAVTWPAEHSLLQPWQVTPGSQTQCNLWHFLCMYLRQPARMGGAIPALKEPPSPRAARQAAAPVCLPACKPG